MRVQSLIGDAGSIPGSRRSPGGAQGIPLEYSCLGNHMDRGVWWPTVHGVAKELDMTQQLKQQPTTITAHFKQICDQICTLIFF